MFKQQPSHISIMNTGHEINLTAILDMYHWRCQLPASMRALHDRLNI